MIHFCTNIILISNPGSSAVSITLKACFDLIFDRKRFLFFLRDLVLNIERFGWHGARCSGENIGQGLTRAILYTCVSCLSCLQPRVLAEECSVHLLTVSLRHEHI